jgi:hypothetical protein
MDFQADLVDLISSGIDVILGMDWLGEGGFVRLQIHMNFDMIIYRQQAPFSGAVAGEQAIKIQSSIAYFSVFLLIFFCIS